MAGPERYARHPAVLLNGAAEYRAAADALCVVAKAGSDVRLQRVIYNLYHHSVELILKAFIATKKQMSEPDPRGHDLVLLLQRAEGKGLCVNAGQPSYAAFFVETLHRGNESYNYRYWNGRSVGYPEIMWTRQTVGELYDKVKSAVDSVPPSKDSQRVASAIIPVPRPDAWEMLPGTRRRELFARVTHPLRGKVDQKSKPVVDIQITLGKFLDEPLEEET